ncbi:alpha/beta hydrolase family protein [Pseudonocardia sediminis]|uniref:Alpha/beta hydrolase family protein n=1 Tax=Pseudonocardia sediminis TaxID=1397368 RepID=A0A4Q7V207_PSEST|nr:alpha/beta hydrolase [Pseudonocardia sediminis]RZT87381.1 alpha/beta hydrolase family protein [Pseudonocardia sediminis]
MPTFAELAEIDPTQWLHQARGWERLGHDLTAQADGLDAAFAPLVGTWTGGDARAAHADRDRLRAELTAAADRSATASEILGRHAGAVLAAQKRMTDAVLGANPATTRVGADGTVLPAEWMILPPFTSPAFGLTSFVTDLARITREISAALEDAARSDRETTAALTALVPAGTAGPAPATVAPGPGTSPAGVRGWWDSLTPAARDRAIAEQPDRVGALDGVPAVARDAANRLRLDAGRDQLLRRRARLVERGDTAAAGQIDELLRGVDAVGRRLRAGEPPALLLGFDIDGPGHAIVAMGNPDTAEHVVTYVPGTTARLAAIETDLHRADATVSAARAADPRAGTAAVTWLGYDAPPDIARAAATGYAERAAEPLARFQEGLRASHQGAPVHRTLVGHSYGSTVAGYAARRDGPVAEDLVLVASPGAGTRRGVADLNTDPEHVWATTAANDPIRQFARTDLMGTSAPFAQRATLAHGLDPTHPAFGARVFASDPGTLLPRPDDPSTPGNESAGTHSRYWDQGSRSWEALGRISVGRPPTG